MPSYFSSCPPETRSRMRLRCARHRATLRELRAPFSRAEVCPHPNRGNKGFAEYPLSEGGHEATRLPAYHVSGLGNRARPSGTIPLPRLERTSVSTRARTNTEG